MRLINIYATTEELVPDSFYAGDCGEDKAAQLVIRLEEKLTGEFDYYLRFCTPEQAQRGGMSVTERLNSSGGVILFVLPKCLMRGGLLRIQLVAAKEGQVVYTSTMRGGLEVKCKKESCDGGEQGDGLYVFRDMADYAANRRKVCSFPFGGI